MNDKSESVNEQPRPRSVTIYGAGVAGLTAAHELVERGFEVVVVEPEPDPVHARDCMVGGMARTQWSRAPRLDNPRQRLERAELEASQPIPLYLGAEYSGYRVSPAGTEVLFDAGRCTLSKTSAEEFDAYITRRVAELYALIERIPAVDPRHRDCLVAVEVVQVLGIWADDDIPGDMATNPDALSIVKTEGKRGDLPVLEGVEGVEGVLTKAENEELYHATALARWRRALTTERCRSVIEKLGDGLVSASAGQLKLAWNRHDLRISRQSDQLVARIKTRVVGDVFAEDRTKSPTGRRCVRVVLDQTKLPGEHGYRFFPAFYRHVFDTMKRIPVTEPEPRELLDYRRAAEVWFWEHGEERRQIPPRLFEDTPQGRTVRDNLIPLTHHTITGPGGEPLRLSRTLSPSVKGLLQMMRDFQRAMDLSYRDIAKMQVKMLQYLTSCPARRDVYARKTWLEYLGGPYSPGFKQAMINWPRALVGLQADKADARTYGDVAVQLVLDQLRNEAYRDGTLNGPTSVAWLEHWRRHLQAQGVTFRRGRLLDLELSSDGSVRPLELNLKRDEMSCWARPSKRSQYYVIAVPPVEARQLSVSLRKQASDLGGAVWEAFRDSDFAPMCTLLDVDGRVFEPKDLGDEDLGGVLQHYSGVQFFLDQDHRLFAGHAYYPDAPWALSSISQVQFRLDPPDPEDGYRGVVSVVVGTWNMLGLGKSSAWRSSGKEFAEDVWQQICVSMGVGDLKDRARPSTPRWYHIDDGILRLGAEHGLEAALGLDNLQSDDEHAVSVGDKWALKQAEWRRRAVASPILAIDHAAAELRARGETDLPYFNRTPYLVCLAGSWARSPGRPGDYRLTYGVVMAGTHMKTHTRLATMEAANESARHAVNAILANYRASLEQLSGRERTDIRVGEPCETWPLVDRELDDLAFLKKIDASLLRKGLPHMFEILEVEQIVDELVPRGEGVESAAEGRVDVMDKIVAVLEQIGAARPASAGAFMLAPLQALLATLRAGR